MSPYITKKAALLIFFAALALGTGVAALLNWLLSGPRLGPHYDHLLAARSPVPAAREILLIDTDELLEPEKAAGALLTMAELNAASIIIQVPVPGIFSGRLESEEEIRFRFEEEYRLLSRNIRNLFEAIRMGSIPPGELNDFVDQLIALAERGRDRLSGALVHQEGEGFALYEKALALSTEVRQAGDLRLLRLQEGGSMDSPWYSRAPGDPDGVLRRIHPLRGKNEHIAYAALKGRFRESAVENTGYGKVLFNRLGPNGKDLVIPLDAGGGVLAESPGRNGGEGFRRIPVSLFAEYEELDRQLLQLLREGEEAGIYAGTKPEDAPLYLAEYAVELRAQMLADPGEDTKREWLKAREAYLKGLETFLAGPAEQSLLTGYDDLLKQLKLNRSGQNRLMSLKEDMVNSFLALRAQEAEFRKAQDFLRAALEDSFCIMGSAESSAASALLANTLLTGRYIEPGITRDTLLWPALALLAGLVCIILPSSVVSLLAGLFLSALIAAAFSWSFVLSGYWIDPLIPLGAMLGGCLFMVFLKALVIHRGARQLRAAYRGLISKPSLRRLLRAGRPALGEQVKARAAIIAIKNPGLLIREDQEGLASGAGAAISFHRAAAEAVKRAGGLFLGCEGDTALVCFGSPLERIALKGSVSYSEPAKMALHFITELDTYCKPPPAKHGKRSRGGKTAPAAHSPWRFGIDCGECLFIWSELSGYTAYGPPVVRARILSGLCSRFNARLLASESVREKAALPARKLSTLGGKDGGKKEAFYLLSLSIIG